MNLLILGIAACLTVLAVAYFLLWLETGSSSLTTVLFQRIAMLEGGPFDGQKGELAVEFPSRQWFLVVPRRWSPVRQTGITVELLAPRNAQNVREAYDLSAAVRVPNASIHPELYCVLRYDWKPGTRNLVYVETYEVRVIQCNIHTFHVLAGDTLPLYLMPACSLSDLEHAVPFGDSKAPPQSTKTVKEIAAENGL